MDNFNNKSIKDKFILEGKRTENEKYSLDILEIFDSSSSQKSNNYIFFLRSFFTNKNIIIIKINLEYYKNNEVIANQIKLEIKEEIDSFKKYKKLENDLNTYIQIENKKINYINLYDELIDRKIEKRKNDKKINK